MTTAVILTDVRQEALGETTMILAPRMDARAWLPKERESECPDLAAALLEPLAGEVMSAGPRPCAARARARAAPSG